MSAVQEFSGRVLPPGEWGKIAHVFSVSDENLPVPQLTKMLTVESENEIVAVMSSQWMIYLSHLWVREDLRGGHLAERLARRTIELYPKGTKALMLTQSTHVERLAHRIGMMPQKGNGWLWNG